MKAEASASATDSAYVKAKAALEFVNNKAKGNKLKAAMDLLNSDKLDKLPPKLCEQLLNDAGMCIHNALHPSPAPLPDKDKKPAAKQSPPSSLGNNDMDFDYDTPMSDCEGNTGNEVPLGVSKDGQSAEAVAVISGPPGCRVPYQVLADYVESKKKTNYNNDGKESDDTDTSEELEQFLKAKV